MVDKKKPEDETRPEDKKEVTGRRLIPDDLIELSRAVWEQLFDDLDLEVQVVPSGMPDLLSAKLLGTTGQIMDRTVCEEAFTNFRNYGDPPVENSLETRLALFRVPIIKRAVINLLESKNAELILKGKDSASD